MNQKLHKKKGALKGTNPRGQTEYVRRFSLFFADSRLFLENKSVWEPRSFADNRRFSQETADLRRNPLKTADWRLSATESGPLSAALGKKKEH